jgi:hypothetical protein
LSSDGGSLKFHERKELKILESENIIMDCATSPATAAPVRHDLSNHSDAESPMIWIHTTCAAEKEWESQALQGELNTSHNATLGLGSHSRYVDFPTDESGGSSEATNPVQSVSSKEVTREKCPFNTTERDQSGNETVHRNDVAPGLWEESAREILGPGAEKNPREPAATADFQLPKEVSTETKGHIVGPMSPMTPNTFTSRPSDEFNCTIDLGSAVSEAIEGLSPIIARESDYPMIERIRLESHVVGSDSKGIAYDAPLGPTSQMKKSNADGLQSPAWSTPSDQDHALTNYQSTQTLGGGDVDTTDVSPEATKRYGMNDSQDIRVLGTSLAMINLSDEAEPKRYGESSSSGDREGQHTLEQAATHFEDEQETGTSNLDTSLEADTFSSQSNTSKEDQALANDQSRQAVENGDAGATEVSPEVIEPDEIYDPKGICPGTSLGTINIPIETETKRISSSNSIGEIASHSELEQTVAHFEKQLEIGTFSPDIFFLRARKNLKEDEAKTSSTSTSIGDKVSHPELEQIAAHFGEEHDTGTLDPEAGYEADVYPLPASKTSEEGEAKILCSENPEREQATLHFAEEHETGASNPEGSREADVVSWQASKRLSSLSSIGDLESHSELEQAPAFLRGKQETVAFNPESSLEVDGVAVDDERTAAVESCLLPGGQLDSPTPSEPSSQDYSDSGENGGTQLESSRAYKDLTSAKKHLDASSLAFIERLRGAAHRRKLQVARSRDALVAKEREQLLSIASAKEQKLELAPELPSTFPPVHERVKTSVGPYKPFKARPAPDTTGHFGSGGQVGVPKVEKKPATTPFSPLLGSRRPRKEEISFADLALRESRKRIESKLFPFKARPAPPTTGYIGHGGQAGVPKIPKRPATVPESPLLGKKRSSFATARKGEMDVSGRGNRDNTDSKFHSMSDVTKAGPFVRFFPGSEVSSIAIVYSLLISRIGELTNRLIRWL